MTNCVCGHDHIYVSEVMGPRLISRCPEKCGCHEYRPELDWPNEACWYWSDVFGLVESKALPNGDGFYLDGYGEDGLREYTTKGPAKFTKLLENNPYKESP